MKTICKLKGNETVSALALTFVLIFSSSIHAANSVPTLLPFQGRATDTGGSPVNYPANFQFRIYPPVGACYIYEDTQTITPNTFGFFATVLGETIHSTGPANTFVNIFSNDLPIPDSCAGTYTPFSGDWRRIEIIVDGVAMTPMQTIGAAAFALNAHFFDGRPSSAYLQSNGTATQTNIEDVTGGGDATTLHHHDSRYARIDGGNTFSGNVSTSNNVYATGATSRVGVGTGSPNADLDILKNSPSLRLGATSGGGGTQRIDFYSGTATQRASIQSSEGSNELRFFTGSSQALLLDNSQNATFAGQVNISNNRITNVGAPAAGTDAVNRTYADTHLAGLNIDTTAATDGQVLRWNATNSEWEANTPSTIDGTKLPLAGGTMSGQINMGSQRIVSMADPTGAQDAATKAYVDTIDAGQLNLSGGTMSGNIAMGTNRITGMGDPTAAQDAATRNYADRQIASRRADTATAPTNGQTLKWVTNGCGAGVDCWLPSADNATDATKLPLAGGTMSGAIAMGSNSITGLAAPSAGGDAVNKTYADSRLASRLADNLVVPSNGQVLKWTTNGCGAGVDCWLPSTDATTDVTKLPLAGGTMSGAIAMGGNNITGVGNMAINDDKYLGLSRVDNVAETAMIAGWAATEKGRMWIDDEDNTLEYWNGGAIAVLGVAGVGLTSLNGDTTGAQTIAVAVNNSITAPDINNAGATHTIRIPNASTATVTDGLLSNAKYVEFDAKVNRSGDAMTGNLTMNAQNDVRLADSDSSNYVAIQSHATVPTNYTITLPDAAPAVNQILKSDASGNLSWVADNATDATKLPLAGGTMSGAIAMGSNSITGLAAPSAGGDAVNKTYADGRIASRTADTATAPTNGQVLKWTTNGCGAGVDCWLPSSDSTTDATKLPLAGGTMSGAIAMGTNRITGMGDPSAAQDAATKNYVDTTAVLVAGSAMTGNLTMNAQNDVRFADGDSSNYVAFQSHATVPTNYTLTLPAAAPGANQILQSDASGNLTWTTDSTTDATKLPLAGGTMSGAIAMGTNRITGMGDPTGAQDAATKAYVDTADSGKLNLTGGTLTGNVVMNAQNDVRFADSDSSNFVAIQSHATVPTNYTITLPDAAPAVNQILKSDASGNLSWVADNATDATKLPLAGGTMSGAIAMGSNSITGLAAPSAGGDAVNKTYADGRIASRTADTATAPTNGQVLKWTTNGCGAGVDCWLPSADSTTDATKLPLAGGTMSGAIAMGGNNITGIGNMAINDDKYLGLSRVDNVAETAMIVGWAATEKGRMWIDDEDNTLEFWNGSAVAVLGVAGVGLTSINGDSTGAQTIAVAVNNSITAPDMNNAGATHTVRIPNASTATVTDGLLSNAKYVEFDAKVNRSGDAMTGNLTMNAQNDVRFADSDSSNYVAIQSHATVPTNYTITLPDVAPAVNQILKSDASGNLSWVADNATDATKLPLAGGTMSGAIAMGTNKITGMGDPTAAQDAATKAYVDTADATKLNLSGGALTGNVTMNAQNDVRFADSDSSNYVAIQSHATVPTNYTITLPDAAPAVNQILKSDASGNLSWVADNATDATKLPLAGGTLTGDVVMSAQNDVRFADSDSSNYVAIQSHATVPTNYTITLPDVAPAVNQILKSDASGNLSWVADNATDATKLPLAGGTMSGAIAMGTNRITGMGDPSAAQDAATKAYVDTIASGFSDATKLPLAGGTMTGNIVMNAQNDVRFADSDSSNFVAVQSHATVPTNYTITLPDVAPAVNQILKSDASGNLSWVADNATDATKLPLAGGTMSGAIAMGTNKITGMGDPTAAQDAATKAYVDTADATKLNLSGGALTGNVTMNAQNDVRFADSDSSNFVAIQSHATVPTNYTITLPDAAPAVNQILKSDASGNLSWVADNATDATKLPLAGGTMSGDILMNAQIVMNAQNDVRFADSDSSNYVAIQSHATVPTNYTITLPDVAPAVNQILKSDASGNLSWVADNATDATKLPLAGGTMSGAIAMGGNNITGIGNMAINDDKYLGLSRVDNVAETAMIVGWAATEKGRMWIDDEDNTLEFWNGSAVAVLGVAGAGLTSVNGDSTGAQTIAVAVNNSITAPDMNNAGATHTVRIPNASTATVTDGLLSNAKYVEFDAKVNRSGDAMTGNLTMNAQNDARFADSDSSNYVAIQSHATVPTNYTITLPDVAPAVNQILKSDASGNLSWVADNATDATKLPLAGGTMSGAIAMGTNKITGMGDPTAAQDAATKNYVDTTAVLLAGSAMTGNLTMNAQNDVRLADTDSSNWIALQSAGVVGTNYTLTFPAAAPGANQILQSDASGNLTWTTDSTTDATKLPLAGGTMTGNVVMNAQNDVRFADSDSSNYVAIQSHATVPTNYTITLPDVAPAVNQILKSDASGNLSWVADNATDATKLPLAGGTMSGAIAMGTNKITGMGDPSGAQDAATKAYVDTVATGFSDATKLPLAGGTMTGNVVMNAQNDVRFADSDSSNYVAIQSHATVPTNYTITLPDVAPAVNQILKSDASGNLSWVADNATDATKLPLAGGTMSGAIAMGTNRITGMGDPSGAQDAATKNYVDTTAVLLAGGAMTGNLTMNAQNDVRLADTDSSNWIALQSAGVVGTNYTLTFPAAAPGANQILQSDASGNLSWVADNTTDATKLPLAGGTMTGNVVMNAQNDVRFADSDSSNYVAIQSHATVPTNYTITLPDAAPAVNQILKSDASGNLSWVADNATDATKLPLAGGTMSGAIAMGTNKITGMGDPTAAQDAATKNYVDTTAVLLAGSAMTGNLTMNAQNDVRLADTDSSNWIALQSAGVVGTNYTLTFPAAAPGANQILQSDASGNLTWTTDSTTDATKLPLAGGTMSGAIAMGTNRITGMGDPTAAQDAATRNYVDTADATKLNLSGGTLTGNVVVNAQNDVRFADSDSSNYVAIQSHATVPTNYTITLPDVAPAVNQILKSDASGNLSWVADNATDATKLPLAGGTMSGAIAMGTNKITGMGDPTAAQDAATKNYIDTTAVLLAGSAMTGNLTMNAQNDVRLADTDSSNWIALQSAGVVGTNYTLTLPAAAPGANQMLQSDASGNLSWVAGVGSYLPLAGGTMSGAIAMGTNRITGMGDPSAAQDAATKAYVDTVATGFSDATKLPLAGGTMTGNVVMNAQNDVRFADSDSSNYVAIQSHATVPTNYTITLPDVAPAVNQILKSDASGNLSWVADNATDATKLPLAGGTMSGAIAMGTSKITGMGDPTAAQDAATKNYVDTTAVLLAGGAMTGNLTMNAQNDVRLADTDSSNWIALQSAGVVGTNYTLTLPAAAPAANQMLQSDASGNLSWVSGTGSYLPLAGGTMSGAIAMGTSKITGMGDPTAAQDAATKNYIDTTAVLLAGSAMTGNLTMNAQNDVRLADTDSSNWIALQSAGVVGTNYTLTLPAAAPGANQMLQSDASGNFSWVAGLGSYLPLAGGTMTGALLLDVGAVGTPSLSFNGDTNTGLYWIGADQIGVSAGGTLRTTFNTTSITSTVPYLGSAGSATNASMSFSADPNTGLYNVGADQLGVTVGGTLRATFNTGDITSTVPYLGSAGSATNASMSFSADPNTGFYNVGADQLGVTVGGTLRTTFNTGDITSTVPYLGSAGSATNASMSFSADPNTGLYNVGADQLGVTVGGTLRTTFNTGNITSTVPYLGAVGTATAPTFSFSGDPNTGIYNIGADQLGVSTNGTLRLTVDTTAVTSTLNVFAPAYFYTSDARLKENIQDIEGLSTILALHGVRFQWKKDGSSEIGLIAQEVEKVLPELVQTNPQTGMKSVKYGNLVAPLIESTKELYQMCSANERSIASVDARVDALEEENRKLRSDIEELKNLIRKLK